jgi:NAD-dependent SIR2 family protein deacetylase
MATCVGPRIIHDNFESESHDHALQKAFKLPGCGKSYSKDFVTKHIIKDKIPICESCSGIVKPNITFFHEPLPTRFYNCL